jgi:hypothetical protein
MQPTINSQLTNSLWGKQRPKGFTKAQGEPSLIITAKILGWPVGGQQ